MNETAAKILEFDKIKHMLMQYAVSEQAKELIGKLEPSIDMTVVKGWLNETTEARRIIDKSSSIHLNSLNSMQNVVDKFGKGTILMPGELTAVLGLLESVKRIKKFMEGMYGVSSSVAYYALSMYELQDLSEEIKRCIESERVSDKASSDLNKIRKKIAIVDDRIKQKLLSILSSPAYSGMIRESVVSIRDGRYVIPIKKEYRKNIDGNVLDSSSSGSTVFVEPAAIRKLQEELNLLKLDEENEVYRILSYLTGIVESYHREISINMETMIHYDFLFAKAKFSKALGLSPVGLNTRNYIRIVGGRHPLIGQSAVPLDFVIGDDYRALVITGPNTGGKTVALKTVGLLTMMVQSGLHVPADSQSEFAVFRDILTDIGDGQSIEQSLSTFSSHIKNISSIIECADPYTLVIMDELGAGTDPAQGTGIAIAVLEEIFKKGSVVIATTHYSEIKTFALSKNGFKNGCMEFDINTLKPLYRLIIGEAGESNAFLIALRLGIDKRIIERAHEITYKEKKDYSSVFKDLPIIKITDDQSIASHEEKSQALKSIIKSRQRIENKKIENSFKLGDCVYISSMDRTGIVCELENSKGELGVMVMKKKLKISKKRLSLHIDGSELYPDDYDFDIIFETKENRKKRKIMDKRHVDGLSIELSD